MIRRALLALPLAIAGCAMPGTNIPAIVFFSDDSALLQPAAQEVVRSAASAAAANPSAAVRVLGFAGVDNASPAFSAALGQARAARVADQLVEFGVARSRIRTGTRTAVAPQFFALEARRVEIRVGE